MRRFLIPFIVFIISGCIQTHQTNDTSGDYTPTPFEICDSYCHDLTHRYDTIEEALGAARTGPFCSNSELNCSDIINCRINLVNGTLIRIKGSVGTDDPYNSNYYCGSE